MNLVPLVDGDLLVYRSLTTKSTIDWVDAVSSVDDFHHHLLETFNGNTPKYFLTGESNFRRSLATIRPYKGHRTEERPRFFEDLREYLVRSYGATLINNAEADDGIVSSHKPGETIIVSYDKDFLQCPGHIYNWYHNTITNQSEETATFNFYCQMLVGDDSDNVPGIMGIGKGKAPDRLKDQTEEEMKQTVLDLYIKQYGEKWGPLAYEEVRQLLWLKRDLNLNQ